MQNHILSIILFTPLIGALVLLFVPKENKDAIRRIANFFALGGFLVSLPLVSMFWAQRFLPGFKFIEGTPNNWIPSIGAGYVIGIDGISFLLIMLTTLLGWISILSSWTAIENRVKEYYVWFLILQTGMLGVFMALDFFLFFVFWEAMLVPMYLLIGIWGGPRRLYAAIKFFLYTLAGSVLMLLGILFLYFHHHALTGIYTFSLTALYETAPKIYSDPAYGPTIATLLFFAFFFAFAIKVPMFPFHTWLPDAHVEAPTPVSVILAGVLLKMGPYGILRFNYPLLPDATQWAATAIAVFGVINIVYAAFVCLAQSDLKRLIAYSSVSHMGFTLLGMAALTPTAIAGAVFNMFSHGIISPMLFLIVGVIYDRAHHREIGRFGGLAVALPEYSAMTGLAFFASLGLPGMCGFVSEFLVLSGSFSTFTLLTTLSATAVIITAAYYLWAIHRAFLGKLNPIYQGYPDLNWRERMVLYPLGAMAIGLGFYPQAILGVINPGLSALVKGLRVM